jgi:hypothetical protein
VATLLTANGDLPPCNDTVHLQAFRGAPCRDPSMAADEKRYPREVFTKKLQRLCERLDEGAERTVLFNDFLDRDASTRVRISSLWVVGSYARGALICGDLDVVIEYQCVEGFEPPTKTLTKTFFGSIPYVSYFFGRPEHSTAGVVFEDVVLIWSGPGCDFRTSIASIELSTDAGRAPRETDSIPLRPDQLNASPEQLQEFAALEKSGIIEWEFAPFGLGDLVPIASEDIQESELRLMRSTPSMGQKTQKLIPAIIRMIRNFEPFGVWHSYGSDRGKLGCGGTALHIGRPAIPWRMFEDINTRQIALVPHISAKGPNGAWLIRRGAKHPDVNILAGRHAFYLLSEGTPIVWEDWTKSQFRPAMLLELFTNLKAANHAARGWQDEDDPVTVGRADGSELLMLFGLGDVIEIKDNRYAVTYSGTYLLESERATVDEVVAALPRTRVERSPIS